MDFDATIYTIQYTYILYGNRDSWVFYTCRSGLDNDTCNIHRSSLCDKSITPLLAFIEA